MSSQLRFLQYFLVMGKIAQKGVASESDDKHLKQKIDCIEIVSTFLQMNEYKKIFSTLSMLGVSRHKWTIIPRFLCFINACEMTINLLCNCHYIAD